MAASIDWSLYTKVGLMYIVTLSCKSVFPTLKVPNSCRWLRIWVWLRHFKRNCAWEKSINCFQRSDMWLWIRIQNWVFLLIESLHFTFQCFFPSIYPLPWVLNSNWVGWSPQMLVASCMAWRYSICTNGHGLISRKFVTTRRPLLHKISFITTRGNSLSRISHTGIGARMKSIPVAAMVTRWYAF